MLRFARPLALLLLVTAFAAGHPISATVLMWFTSGPASCANVIVEQIAAARRVIRVQAYYFTSPQILQALAAAKSRGLDVAAIVIKSQDRRGSERSRYNGATQLVHAGIPISIHDRPAIAHNKIIIIAERIVKTGIFDYTRNADERNAENVVVLDSPELARQFGENWVARRCVSYSFGTE